MANTINTHKISNIYSNWQPRGYSGAPLPGRNRMSPVMPVDRVTLSEQALKEQAGQREAARGLAGEQELNEEQKQQVRELKKRDVEVKSHEQAHMASGGGLVQGGASFEYQSGPDGRMYAVGGEVKIDMSPERTPEATIRKMQQVRRAALAPAEPSGTDRAVAAQAAQIEARARMERTQNSPQGAPIDDDTASAFHQSGGRRIDLVI
jgi:hypothetical protein